MARQSIWISTLPQIHRKMARNYDGTWEECLWVSIMTTFLHEAAHAFESHYCDRASSELWRDRDMIEERHSSRPSGSYGAGGGHGRIFATILSVVARIALKESEKNSWWGVLDLTDEGIY